MTTAGAAFGLIAATLLGSGVALAVHDEGVFQMDGNALTAAGSENPGADLTGAHDWDQVYTDRNYKGNPPFPNSGAETQSFVTDLFGAGDSIFQGGQTKDILDLPNNWQWKQTTTTSVQDKDDIEHAFAAQYNVDKSGSSGTPGCGSVLDTDPAAKNCVLLYFGADRFANSGDTTMGFWFYKGKVGLSTLDANGNGTFTGKHTARSGTCPGATCVHGDILILSDFLIGGAAPTVAVYEWVDSGGSASTHLDLIGGGTGATADCTNGAPPKKGDPPVPPVPNNDNLCATTNANVVVSPWPFTAKANSGGTSGAGGTAKFGISEFMEGGVNMTALGLGNECFNSFLAETRASHSPTSTLSDFALGNFGSCGASLKTESSNQTSYEVGGSAPTDTATITTSSSGGNAPAPDGTTSVSFYLCGPSTTAISICDPTGLTAFDTEPLSGATKVGNDYSVTSSSPTITSAGYYCFAARWPGDTNYTDGPYADNGNKECFQVTPKQPTISTQVNTEDPVVPGTEVWDSALLGNVATPSNGTNGTITFKAYAPSDPTCASTAVYTSVIGVTGPGTYLSKNGDANNDGVPAETNDGDDQFKPTTPGTYNWVASYAPASGDVNNQSAATGCGDAHESSIVQQFQPSLVTVQTVTIKDKATISATGGGDLKGTAHIQPFSDSSCTAGNELAAVQDIAVAGASPQDAETTPMTITVANDKTIYWQVSYTSTNSAQKDIAATCTENSLIDINN